ncbi:MAG: family 43 glycosylhydrolase [Bacteroidaceae bacterium]|nr:family 43 glycosylhydrolase [Bacteroidaceae bacterium]
MKLNLLLTLLSFAVTFMLPAQESISLTASQVNSLYRTQNRAWVSVHDPSVVHASGNTFYIMGSHRAWARSTDHLVSFQGLDNSSLFGIVNSSGKVVTTNYANAFSTNQTKTVPALVDGQVQAVSFGNFDARDWAHGDQTGWDITGNMWAPDIIWNPTMEKWCMYMSLNGDYWHSVIVLLTADKITGPYVYQGPVTYSGFLNTTTPEISWKKTDLELVLGELSTLPARYQKPRSGNGNWGEYWPNNIDPCVFFDEDGQLWMSYGSWSGGIFILKLDKQTGLRDYTVTYPVKNDNGGRAVTDPYFGKRIAGGYYSSGEASYIQRIGRYYYLFMSYGALESTGGYEIAIFRSEHPDGPYLDASNLDAFYNGRYWLNYGPNAQTTGGMRPFGAYDKWGFMPLGELAQGHNSAIVDEQGRAFIVYHTRFNDGGEGHQVRAHQLFQNQQGWLCVAPFQFDGEKENDDSISSRSLFTKEQMVGTYEVLIHRYKLDHKNREVVTPVCLHLNDNGRITGDLTGTWSLTEGTGYIKVVAGGVTYNGVVVEQQMDGTTMKAICFTATASSGVSIWGYKARPDCAVAYTAKQYTIPVTNNQLVTKNLPLYGDGQFGATIEWESSVPEIISNTGKYAPADTATRVQLTCRIRAENYVYERTYNVTAQRSILPEGDALSGIAAYYDFDEKPTLNLYNNDQRAYYARLGNGKVPELKEHPARTGQVAQLYEAEQKNVSYVRFDNPLVGRTDLEGFTVSAWVLRGREDLWNTLWSFTDKMGNLTNSVQQRFFLTGNGFMGFDDGEHSFDINRPNDAGTNATAFIPVGQWAFVTVTVSPADGVSLYVDGVKKAHKTFTSSAGTASTAAAAARLFDYQTLVNFITSAGYMQLGTGSHWGSAEACFDDLLVFSRALTAADVRALNSLATRVTDFGPEGMVGVRDLENVNFKMERSRRIFDLTGRWTNKPLPGHIYIINGHKVRF